MIIHNFFSDVLLSVLNLYENYIFHTKPYFRDRLVDSIPESFFKSVQFNIGNRNYQIGDYKEAGQLEFPTGLFTFVSDETAFGKTAALIGHHRIMDVNEILGTYNKQTRHEIRMREEQAILYLTVQINCESQLQANEVVHQIKRFLPPGKYVQLMPYSSFMEIPNFMFDNKANNPNIHDIDNLFLKYDDTVGDSTYYFQTYYKPMIRLNSANADISDSGMRSYTVLCDFSYLIQLPMWLFDTNDSEKITRINLGFMIDKEPSSIIVDNDFLNLDNKEIMINDIQYVVRDKYIVDYNSSNFKDNKIILPKPKENFIISVGKVTNKKSLVVDNKKIETQKPIFVDIYDLINSTLTSQKPQSENKNNLNTKITNNNINFEILDSKFYEIQQNQTTNNEDIIIFIDDNTKPTLNNPVIIKFLSPQSNEDLEKRNKKKKVFNNVYEIRPNKRW